MRESVCALESLKAENQLALEDALKSKTTEEEASSARNLSLQREIESQKEDSEKSASVFDVQMKSLKDEMTRAKNEV